MKALVITEPGCSHLTEVPDPQLTVEDVLLEIQCAGLCGSDLSTYRGKNPLAAYPRIPGHELAATILQTGSDVPDDWKSGDDVLVIPYSSCGKCSACRQGRQNCCRHNQTLGVQRDGGISQYLAVPWTKLLKAPGLSHPELALVEPLTVGYHAVARGRVTSTDTVLVFGCGAIGLGAISGAARRGARVIAADLDDKKLELAVKAGAAVPINSGRESLQDLLDELTDKEGPQVVIEAVGSPATFRAAVEIACFAGRVVYIGYSQIPVEYETKWFVQKELDILGSRNAAKPDFEAAIQTLQAAAFPVKETITCTVPLDDAPQAMEDWNAKPLAFTKIQVSLANSTQQQPESRMWNQTQIPAHQKI